MSALLLVALAACAAQSCKKAPESSTPTGASCTTLTGTSWSPNVTGASSSNHDATTTIYKDVYTTGSFKVTGLDQTFANGGTHMVTVSGITMTTDLGTKGSLSLIAEAVGFPSALTSAGGYAYPILVSLNDGTHELVNVDLATCASGGFYTISGSTATAKAGCGPKWPTAYMGGTATTGDSLKRDYWDQFQRTLTTDNVSVNTFPTCNWVTTSPYDETNGCAFNNSSSGTAYTGFFSAGKLRTGTYTAKYMILTNFAGSSIGDSYAASLKLTVVRKVDSNAGGATDVNVILVGNKNIQASRSAKGKQNLDQLMTSFYNYYNQASPGVKIGTVNVVEWDCANGGDAYATVNSDSIGDMIAAGSAKIPSSTETTAINIFLVSEITSSGSYTILGQAGGILGAMVNGKPSSGAAFSSFDKLDTYNPNCTGTGACTVTMQEEDFIQMGMTIAHEAGHFLGLNHPSESDGTTHDHIPDTPQCTATSGGVITTSSCRTQAPCSTDCPVYTAAGGYCPTISTCEFNHTMWWFAKNINSSGVTDGNIFSTNSSTLINYNPYVQ